jgi:transposase
MIALEKQLDIQLLHKQGLSKSHIARRLGIDRRTVQKYIEHPETINQPRKAGTRSSKVDAFKDQIALYLGEDPHYRASWIYDRLKKNGYDGCYELVKRVVRSQKAEKSKKAYIRFETEPGQQAQVDFAEFAVAHPDGSVTKYYLFSLILGYSRMLYCELLTRCDMVSFLSAHIHAFEALGGIPTEILYDRMKNVFIRQLAGKTDFTQSLVNLAVHYGFTPRVAPAYAPWVKGKVERPFDFIREGFWRGYRFTDLAAANRDLGAWLAEKAERVPATTSERVDVRFEREKSSLLRLPPHPCDVSERLCRTVWKDCAIRVEGNRYVVAHTLVGKKVLARKKDDLLRIFADDVLVVTYTIPEGRGHLVADKRFYQALLEDHEMQERKFARGRGHKGRAVTISPTKPKYPLEVHTRPLSEYQQLGGEVCYA